MAVHVKNLLFRLLSLSVSFGLTLHFWDKKKLKKRMRQRKRITVHELPHKEIVKSGIIDYLLVCQRGKPFSFSTFLFYFHRRNSEENNHPAGEAHRGEQVHTQTAFQGFCRGRYFSYI